MQIAFGCVRRKPRQQVSNYFSTRTYNHREFFRLPHVTANFCAGFNCKSCPSPKVIAGITGTEPNSKETMSIVSIQSSGRGFSHFVVIKPACPQGPPSFLIQPRRSYRPQDWHRRGTSRRS